MREKIRVDVKGYNSLMSLMPFCYTVKDVRSVHICFIILGSVKFLKMWKLQSQSLKVLFLQFLYVVHFSFLFSFLNFSQAFLACIPCTGFASLVFIVMYWRPFPCLKKRKI